MAAPPADRRLLWEAAVLLVLARTELAILPFARVMANLSASRRKGAAPAPIARVRWAVDAVARQGPLRFACLPQAIATVWMLQSRGHAPKLIYGVNSGAEGYLAHAWVELDGNPVIGYSAGQSFVRLTAFP